jgi:hypothetical protein
MSCMCWSSRHHHTSHITHVLQVLFGSLWRAFGEPAAKTMLCRGNGLASTSTVGPPFPPATIPRVSAAHRPAARARPHVYEKTHIAVEGCGGTSPGGT